ncbi:hypothetical protein L228DRAFT_270422 [Xylona heveae TC161]|uniref:Uncharacterized protein n=1 Tax=Xylona heveae (strain CBS 132557 / TC161) TaxID=1328760 RepID=A0A165AEH6_XYLHT|nr:hypothetical protein L228DRAFT_270422 [Xylona heveae TC161]KZF20345.1 hypothetical protein L228DRAFT_270422 [Xylona heveae TC161]
MLGMLCIIIITLLLPPLGVFLVAGCGADLLINILLTLLGYFPGHIHAFYVEYVYYHRRKYNNASQPLPPAGGIYSPKVQNAGGTQYGTVPT